APERFRVTQRSFVRLAIRGCPHHPPPHCQSVVCSILRRIRAKTPPGTSQPRRGPFGYTEKNPILNSKAHLDFLRARRLRALAWLLLASLLLAASPARAHAFDLARVAAKARALASQPYQAPATVPKVLKDLTYDQYREIHFRKASEL